MARFILPLREPIDQAWSLVGTDGLDPSIVEAWRVNGMRIGLLARNQWETFVDSLPRALHTQMDRIHAADQAIPILASRVLTETVELELPWIGDAVKVETIIKGRCQLLVQVRNTQLGLVAQLTPHHYLQRVTLEPRSAVDKNLEGRAFDEMSITAPFADRDLVVVTVDLPSIESATDPPANEPPQADPAPPSAPDASVQTESPPTPQPAADASHASESPRDGFIQPPNHFGRWLLTASRNRKPVRMVVVMSINDGS